jgi:DinB superfamily
MFRESLEMFRSTRSRTIEMADELSQEQLDFAPAAGKWSAGEVLDHLLLAEKLNRDQVAELIELKRTQRKPFVRRTFADVNVSIGYIPKCLLPIFEVPFTLLNTFTPAGVREYMTRNRLVPAQHPDVATPRKGRSAAELRENLARSLKETENLFNANADLHYSEMIAQHPLLGTNNVPGLLRFMAAHEQRHQSQINNIMASPQFPRPQSSGKGVPHVELRAFD